MRSKGLLKNVREKLYANAYPCMKQEHSRDFDFWLGEWKVFITGTETLIGKSSITKDDGGCTVMEHYTSITLPYSGHSINFYNPSAKYWEQLYVGSGGRGQLYTNGECRDSAMRFDYTIVAGDKKMPGHFIFYNLGPDKVRQYQDLSSDGGLTYKVNYDYTYVRVK